MMRSFLLAATAAVGLSVAGLTGQASADWHCRDVYRIDRYGHYVIVREYYWVSDYYGYHHHYDGGHHHDGYHHGGHHDGGYHHGGHDHGHHGDGHHRR